MRAAAGGGGGKGGGGAGPAEAPAVMMQSRRTSGEIPTVASDNNLEMLEKRWREARPRGRHGPSSRLVRALVEQRYLVMGSSSVAGPEP